MRAKRQYLSWRLSKMRRRIIRSICGTLYQDRNLDIHSSIMVAGTGRSGTTWLADIIASQLPCRIMFEPFYSGKVEAFRRFHYFQYMRDEDDDRLYAYCTKVFTGKIKDRWIDRQVEEIFPRYRLIKEIRANLFLRWVHDRFPNLPILFMIRHPCAVVLSRMQLHWDTDGDIQSFMDQPRLIEDFLSNKMDVINRIRTPEEKHAVIWCISNLVPLKQFCTSQLAIVFYEQLSTQPEIEIPRIFHTIGHTFQDSVFHHIYLPSTTTNHTSAIVTGRNKVSLWQEALTSTQIDSILSIVKEFELDYLYGDSPIPLVHA